jgi:hypothetical protein
VLWPLQQHLPPALLQGGYGLMKSFLFALFIVLLTAGFEKINIRMKI